MDKSMAGLMGAMGALAAAGSAHAAPVSPAALNEAMRIESYADLLKPIPNALAVRDALAETQAAEATPEVMTVQYYHHHHHRYYRRRFYHHHHHHHHHHRFYR